MQLSGYTRTPFGLRTWVLALAALFGTSVFIWSLTGPFQSELSHIVLYISIFICVLVLGNIRIELNSGLYSFQVSILVPLLAFVNLEENLTSGYAVWGLGMVASCILLGRKHAIIVRFASSMLSGAVFLLSYVFLRDLGANPMLSAWSASMLSLLATILLYSAATYSVDQKTGKKHFTVRLRMSQLTLVVILFSSLTILGVWVQEGFGVLEIAATGNNGRAAIFLLMITLMMHTSYTRNSRKRLQRRFEGIATAAMALPWADDNITAQKRLREFTAKAIPNSTVQIRDQAPGLGEVGSAVLVPDVGQQYLVVSRRPGGTPFSALEQRLVEAIGHMGAETMRSKTENTVLAQEANTDPLTGLANYRALQEALQHADAESESNMAMLFIDVDEFKHINDVYGHNVGNIVLQAIAGRIRSTIRPYDLAARIGGDEFVVLLREVDGPESVEEVVQRIHDRVARPIAAGRDLMVQVTISIGTARPEDRVDMSLLLS
ncbi:MAG: GGDEF domain-containing protein, partial [Microbacteriaceae bacterium]